MKLLPWRGRPTQFRRASDGSMTLIEHFLELRNRLFKACVAVVVCLIGGFIVLPPQNIRWFLARPYCDTLEEMDQLPAEGCSEVFIRLGPLDVFLLDLKIALGVGLLLAGPIWLYQLWAFIAPGLHGRERKWAYMFAAIATPLFAGGAALAYFVLGKALGFLLGVAGDQVSDQLEITRYISFVINMLLSAGFAFQFPLIILMLNFTGIATARRLLSWWRVTVFLMFLLAALITPTPEPFTMGAIGLALSSLYFIAVGVAYLNDRRRARRDNLYGDLSDDETSSLDDQLEPVGAPDPVEPANPVEDPLDAPPQRDPRRRGYDDLS